MSQQELLKQAYELGVMRAAQDAGLEKEAFLQYLKGAWTLGKGALGKVLDAGRLATYGGGPMAERITKSLATSPTAQSAVRQALMGGAFGGTLNVAFGDSSTPWYKRYVQGALPGVAAGAAMGGAAGGVRKLWGMAGQTKWLGARAPNFARRLTDIAARNPETSTWKGLWQYAKGPKGTLGEAAKRYGTYALTGVPMIAGGLLASTAAEGIASRIMGREASPAARIGMRAAPAMAAPFQRSFAASAPHFGLSPVGVPYGY